MADNLTTQTTLATPPSGSVIAARQVTYSGDTSYVAPVGIVAFSGADDAKVATDVPGGGGVEAAALRVTLASDSTGVITVKQATAANLKVDPSSVTSPISAASLPLPTGAATAAKQPALGTAGAASADVLTIQGVASMTKLLVTPDSVALPANQSVNVSQINGVAPTMGNGASGTGVQRVTLANDSTGVLATVSTVTAVTTLTGGAVAHDGVDSGNPLKVGFKAKSSPKGFTLVSDADRVDATSDLDSIQLVKLNTTGADIISERVSNTDGASTAFSNFSAVASTKNYITGITCYRTDAGTSMAYIDFRDGTAGSILWSMPLPPNGGSTESWATPAFHTSANTALAFDVSAALTTVYINVTGFQSKV